MKDANNVDVGGCTDDGTAVSVCGVKHTLSAVQTASVTGLVCGGKVHGVKCVSAEQCGVVEPPLPAYVICSLFSKCLFELLIFAAH
eukprot:10112653-Ditylum_brightwellii.AAC.1